MLKFHVFSSYEEGGQKEVFGRIITLVIRDWSHIVTLLERIARFSLGESAKLPSTCHSETNMVHVVRMAEEKPSALAKLPWLATHVTLLEPQVPMDPGQL